MSASQHEKYQRFKGLHEDPGAFVIPNPWNAGTARLLTNLGFEALATTSAGLALSIGCRDPDLTRDQVLANAREIVEATDLPVSADLENGFGERPEACVQTIEGAAEVGLVGGSIEDSTGDPVKPIFDFALAVERVAAACEAARGHPFVLTARSENFLHGRPNLDDTIHRLQAFAEAGADVLYAPGLPDIGAIRAVCEAVDKPVNVVMGLVGPICSVEELEAAGVKRISVGGAFARTAMGALFQAAKEVKENGTFEFSKQALSGKDAASMTAPPKE